MGIRIDEETLARAALTYCLNSADAIMCVTVNGAGSAREVFRLLAETRSGTSSTATKALDDAFARGIVRCGREVTARSMDAFHRALACWTNRYALLPTLDHEGLTDWLTSGGKQWIIAPHSPWWPGQLSDLSIRRDWAPPLCLWGVGDPSALTSCPNPISVVGSRGVNVYGRSLAREIGRRVAQAGHLLVSGGAMGTDAAAHWGAVSAMSSAADPQTVGRTVAVFAGGLNHAGPQCNSRLFDQIVNARGALISELCPGTIPEAYRFLLRNRIIAALSTSVIVAQARLRSGALNTANWAAELNREVYAAPGDAGTAYNAGCNRLIRDHQAILFMAADEVTDICHPAHHPLLLTDKDADPPSACSRKHHDTNDAIEDAPQGGMSSATADEETSPAARRQSIYTAIRRCRKAGLPANIENITRHADGFALLSEVVAELGRMELDGLVTVSQGAVSIVRA